MIEKENLKERACLAGCLRVFTRGVGGIVLILVFLVGLYLVLRGAGAYLIVADELEPAKAIVVLSGGTETRMQEALNLYIEGFGDLIILTETGEEIPGFEMLHSFDMRIQLMNNGVPSGNILVTSIEVSSTLEEAKAVLDLLKRRQISSAIVVTDPYHTRRTRIIFNDIFHQGEFDLAIRPVRGSWFNSRTWFLSLQGWQFTTLEYLKLIGYTLGLESS
jgi:uncharacterized SAM-binding protein YcdF (DUF218 family)